MTGCWLCGAKSPGKWLLPRFAGWDCSTPTTGVNRQTDSPTMGASGLSSSRYSRLVGQPLVRLYTRSRGLVKRNLLGVRVSPLFVAMSTAVFPPLVDSPRAITGQARPPAVRAGGGLVFLWFHSSPIILAVMTSHRQANNKKDMRSVRVMASPFGVWRGRIRVLSLQNQVPVELRTLGQL